MTIITLASAKGGVGKTTIAGSLAVELSMRGFKTHVVDADPNEHLFLWFEKMQQQAASEPGLDIMLDRLSWRSVRGNKTELVNHVRDADSADGFVVIDLPGVSDDIVTYGLGVSDFVIIPAQPSAMDLREVLRATEVLKGAEALLRRLVPYRVLLTRLPSLRTRVQLHAEKELEAQGIPVFAHAVMDRTIFRETTFNGLPVNFLMEENAGARAAADNIGAVVDELLEALGVAAAATPRLRAVT